MIDTNVFVRGFSGHFAKHCKRISFRLTDGQEFSFGADVACNYHFDSPPGYVIYGFAVGASDHLDTLTAKYGVAPKLKHLEEPPIGRGELCIFGTKSATHGKSHGDTKPFDDFAILDRTKVRTRIEQLTVFYDDEHVFGIQVDYDVNGKTVYGEKHVGSDYRK